MLGKVRPTTSKVLESILATLAEHWQEARVLDLFAGSGCLGQAAHRAGAAEVVFVEGHRQVAAQLPKLGKIVVGRLPAALNKLEGAFDIILGDPPYGAPEGPAVLQQLAPWLTPKGWVVWEHHHKDPYQQEPPGLTLWRCRRFGETAISYYHRSDLE